MHRFSIDNDELRLVGSRPETAEAALDLSIEKWDAIAAHIVENPAQASDFYDGAERTCGLCIFHRFKGMLRDSGCGACPVAAAGFMYCVGSPYTGYCTAEEAGDSEAMLHFAAAERDFLKSLK